MYLLRSLDIVHVMLMCSALFMLMLRRFFQPHHLSLSTVLPFSPHPNLIKQRHDLCSSSLIANLNHLQSSFLIQTPFNPNSLSLKPHPLLFQPSFLISCADSSQPLCFILNPFNPHSVPFHNSFFRPTSTFIPYPYTLPKLLLHFPFSPHAYLFLLSSWLPSHLPSSYPKFYFLNPSLPLISYIISSTQPPSYEGGFLYHHQSSSFSPTSWVIIKVCDNP